MQLTRAEFLEKMKARLLSRRDELANLSRSSAENTKPVELDQQKMGRLSRMDAMQVQAMATETERRRVIELDRISSALDRISKDIYGECVKCEEDISMKRLEVDPSAPLCVPCANQMEKRD